MAPPSPKNKKSESKPADDKNKTADDKNVQAPKLGKDGKVLSKKEAKAAELSEEDNVLREELDKLVEKCTLCIPLSDKDKQAKEKQAEKLGTPISSLSLIGTPQTFKSGSSKVINEGLKEISKKLKEASSTMTSVPKPLKFLRQHFEFLKSFFEKNRDVMLRESVETKQLFADILSVLAAVKGPPKDLMEKEKERILAEIKLEQDANRAKEHANRETTAQAELEREAEEQKKKDEEREKEKEKEMQQKQKDEASKAKAGGEGEVKTKKEEEESLAEKEKEREEEKKKKAEGPYIREVNPYDIDKARQCLKYRLEGTPNSDKSKFCEWGHEYVRHLSGEILYCFREEGEEQAEDVDMLGEGEEPPPPSFRPPQQDMLNLLDIIIPFQFEQQEEVAALDLLYETNLLAKIPSLCDKHSFTRIALYLQTSASYASSQEDSRQILKVVYDILIRFEQYPEALRIALKMKDRKLVKDSFDKASNDEGKQIQMGFLLRQHRYDFKDEDNWPSKVLEAAMGENFCKKYYLALGKEVDVLTPKHPDDIYKLHLQEGGGRAGAGAIDSAKMNLATTYVNGFVNAGFGKDKLMSVGEVWLLNKNKEHGMLAAAASRCLISLWDPDVLDEVDKYQYSNEEYVKAGYYLSLGLALCNIRAETDPVWALVMDTVESGTDKEKLAAILGLGFAYAGTGHEEIQENLTPMIVDVEAPIEVAAVASLTIGMVMMGSANEDLIGAIVATLEERQKLKGQLDSAVATLFAAALGLLMCGVGEGGPQNANSMPASETGGLAADDECSTNSAMSLTSLIDLLKSTLTHPIGKFTQHLVYGFAYAGSGNVLTIQKLMQVVAGENKHKTAEREAAAEEAKKKKEKEEKDGAGAGGASASSGAGAAAASSSGDKSKDSADDETELGSAACCPPGSAALLSIAAIACCDDISRDMTMRMTDHVLQYGNLTLKRTIPLAIGLLYVSNAKQQPIDLLSKLSHDSDSDVALSAIFGLGLVGAGTNHAKIAGLLRSLAAYYESEPNILFIVKIAQGLLYLGKGLLTLSPLHSDRFLANQTAISSLLVLLTSTINTQSLFFKSHMHWLLFFVVPAISPRMLICVDEETLEPVPVSVRVGAAVDIVGQGGNPKSVTGFQTHSTPVLLGHGDRAELATDEYIAKTTILEGVVVVNKNPEFQAKEGAKK